MATLLELQEIFRNISDPEVEELLRTSPKEQRWMVMDEKRRRGEMREAAKAMQSESQMKPRNMLEEYQANTSSVLGGQSLGDIGQSDQGQYGEMESSGGLDPYADQQAEVPGFWPGGLVPVGAAVGRAAAGSSIPWLAKLAQRLGARAVPQAPAAAGRAVPLPPGWTQGPYGVPVPPAGTGVARGGYPLPGSGSPTYSTPIGRIPGRLPDQRPVGSVPSTPPEGTTGAAAEVVKKSFPRRHPFLTGGAGYLAYKAFSGDDEEQDPSGVLAQGSQPDQNAPQGTEQYLQLLQRIVDRDDELRDRIGDSRISRKDKIRRIGLAAAEAMMTTPGGFGRGLGAAFGAAGDEIGAINQEEDTMLRNAVYEYQVGSGSATDLIRAIAAINRSMQSGGRGGMTDTMLAKLLESYGLENIPQFLNDLNRARAMVSGQGQVAQTDFDHSSIDSIYGTD